MNDPRLQRNRNYGLAQSQMSHLPNYYAWTVSKLERYVRGCVVELGSGLGMSVEHYVANVDQIIAVDHDPTLLRNLRARFPHENVQTRTVDLLSDWSPLSNIRADTIVALDILEHFENDQKFLEQALRLLKPSGLFCIKVPAQQRLFCAIDEAAGHFRRYEPQELTLLFSQYGCCEIMQQYLNPLGAWVYRIKRKKPANFSSHFPPAVLRAVNRAIPIIALLDRIQVLKGLSLVAVYRKDSGD